MSYLVLYTDWSCHILFTEQVLPSKDRESNFSSFFDWLKSKNVDTSCVEIASFQDVGHGLKATKDLKVHILKTTRQITAVILQSSRKVLIIFIFLHKNIGCGYYSLEMPYWDSSNESPTTYAFVEK